MIPDFLTHYYIPDKNPFQTLSDLSPQKLEKVLKELNDIAASKNSRRLFPDWYVGKRKEVEFYLRDKFLKKGGKPVREHPFYLCFGSSNLLENVTVNTRKIKLMLNDIPDEVLSFTYQDSMVSMRLYESGLGKPYHGEVYLKDEILQVINQYGFPKDACELFEREKFINYIEAQLWSDEPIKNLINDRENGARLTV